MKIAILGARGRLGSALARAAPDAVALGREDLDLAAPDLEARLDALDAEVVINAAAYTAVDACESDPAPAEALNARAPARLAEACARRDRRLIHVSTDYVFGAEPHARPIPETAPVAPLNVYGRTKARGEAAVLASGADALVVRVAGLFGPDARPDARPDFPARMIALARAGGRLKVVTDQRLSPTYAEDAARAILTLARERAPAGIWHAVNAGDTSWRDLAVRALALAGVAAEVEGVPAAAFAAPASRPAFSVLDGRKLAAFGVVMPPWEEALARRLRGAP